MQKRIIGLFTRGVHGSDFFGNIETSSESESIIRTTDIQGSGDAVLNVQVGKDFLLINPLSTTTARTIDRIYHMILEKIDVDSIIAHKLE